MKKSLLISALAFLCLTTTVSAYTEPGIFLQDKGWLWVQKDDGVMAAKVKLDEGTPIDVYTETKDATYESAKKGATLNFVKVSYDSKDYWAISNRIITGKKRAVVIEDAAIYNTPSFPDVRNAHLEKGSIVGIGKTFSAGNGVTFQEVSYYSEKAYSVRTLWIQAKKISSDLNDIEAFRIIARASQLTSVDQREAILKSAEKLKLSPEVAKIIAQEIEDLDIQGDVTLGGTIQVSQPESIKYVTAEDGLNARNIPGLNGIPTAKLEYKRKLTADLKTIKEQTIDGISAPWFEVYDYETGDYIGWVFGGYVTTEDAE